MRAPRVAFAMLPGLVAAVAMAAEPPARLQVKIGDARTVVETGKAAEIMLDGKRVRLLIEELPTRRFDEAGVRFDYPRHFPWEEDGDSWTLDGNSAVVIITLGEAGQVATPTELLDGIEEAFKTKRRAKREPVMLETRQGRIEGLAAIVKLASSSIRNEAYVLERSRGPVILLLQDSLDDAGKPTAEFIDMRKRLVDTLEY